MRGQDIKDYLIELKAKILITPQHAFTPHEWHVYMQIKRGGGDVAEYFEYDSDKKIAKGISRTFLPKVEMFLQKTGNQYFIKELRESVQ